jgi:hypothetical protein
MNRLAICRLAGALVVVAASTPALSQSAKEWGSSTRTSYMLCAMNLNLVFLAERLKEPTEERAKTDECVDTAVAKAQQGYESVAAGTSGASSPMLKDYYAVWLSGMRGLKSLQFGSRGQARATTESTKQRLGEIWTRFEIEAGQ